MSSHGIKDRVAIVGMGCTPFREHWDKGLDDLAVEGTHAGLDSAGIAVDDEEHTEGICALGTGFIDPMGRAIALSIPVPTTRDKPARSKS